MGQCRPRSLSIHSVEGFRLDGPFSSGIRCDPVNIPRRIEADVTHVVIGHSLHVSDLKVPDGVEILDEPEATVAVVSAPKVEVEPVAAVEGAEAPEEPELIRKTKAEEEGEGEAK